MKRWFAVTVIALYLSALGGGIAAHAMNFGTGSHPIMYYFVWDMFCGWSAHEIRYHIVGEGESGQFYELTQPPWGTFLPYGDLPRTQYDILGNGHRAMALHILKRTDHEPITNIYVIEETWPKKFNLPDHAWAMRFDEPKDPKSYFWLRSVMDGEGNVLKNNVNYLTYLSSKTVADNPRLREDTQRGKPFYAITRENASATEGVKFPGADGAWSRPSAN